MRVLTMGFEIGMDETDTLVTYEDAFSTGNGSAAVTTDSRPDFSDYALEVQQTGGHVGSRAWAAAVKSLGDTYDTLSVRAGIWFSAPGVSTFTPDTTSILGELTTTNLILLGEDTAVRFRMSGGILYPQLALWDGSAWQSLGESALGFAQETWTCVEARIATDGAGTLTEAKLWLFNMADPVIDVSSSATAAGTMADIRLNCPSAGFSPTYTVRFDDVAVNDDTDDGTVNVGRVRDGSIIGLRTDGDGDSTDWSIAGSTPAATNWESVNDVPPDDDDTYVESDTSTELDLYTAEDLPSIVITQVYAAALWARVKADPGGDGIELPVKQGGTRDDGDALPVTTSDWTIINRQMSDNPTDDTPWTHADIDDTQIGVRTP